MKIQNFGGLTFMILAFSSGRHWQSTSSRTFIYSNVSFIIHYVLNQIEGMQRSVEDNCGKVEKHKEFDISIFPFFQASISTKIDKRIQPLKRHLCLHLLPLMILFPANTPQLPSMHWLCNYLEKLLVFVCFYPTESFSLTGTFPLAKTAIFNCPHLFGGY